jgi:2-oxoglutarate dehydrogenase E2 component (dihydrolipoamide succinyltransferase)
MATQVIMPQLGESVDEGTISKWLINIGDEINEFDPLVEVNTDKVDSEIPSPASGTLLAIMIPEGTTISAGTLLAWIGEPGEQIPSSEDTPIADTPKKELETTKHASFAEQMTPVVPSPGRDKGLGFISPVVAKISSEEGVDLSLVDGTGHGGRITKKDVLTYIERQKESHRQIGSAPPVTIATEQPTQSPISHGPQDIVPGELLPHTIVRRRIAEHMLNSKKASPHVTTVMEADLKNVVEHRQDNKILFSKDGVNLTFTAYFIVATVKALKAHPIVNSSWTEEGIQIHKEINIGMATSMGEEGLIVPVIKMADRLSILGLAKSINDLADRARNHQLKPDEVQGGTFTITNHGTSGSLFASPIINQPQCAILGIGMIQKRVVVIEDAIAIRPMVYLSLTFDHRILDGAIADNFLAKVVESLQNWN